MFFLFYKRFQDASYISHNFIHELPGNETKPYEFISYDRIYVRPTNHVHLGTRNNEKEFICKALHAQEDEINKWVSRYSKEVIQCFLAKGSIAKDMAFAIVSIM